MALTKQRQQAKDPIGIFDSGVGGLTVAKEIHRHLPHESLIYLGDTARTPYGTKAGETVKRFTLECVHYLAAQHIKALVVACNTASAYALPALQQHFSFPIIGVIGPGARAALRDGRHGTVGVIGTRATIHSQAYTKTIHKLDARRPVVAAPCPLLVPLVEEGWLKTRETKMIIHKYLAPLLKKKIGHLILGCTHYPALKKLIAEVCGSKVAIIDSAEEVAKELTTVLKQHDLLTPLTKKGVQKFLVTDIPDQFVEVGTHIIGKKITSIRRVVIEEVGK